MKLLLLLLLLIMPNHFFAQRVQLSGIPGQDSDMDITDMHNQIMAPYYDEITNLNNQQRNREIELELWDDFKTNVDNFDKINRYIYGYDSAFKSLTNENSNPSSLGIQIGRNAKTGTYKINIKQLADVDSFVSDIILSDQQIPASTFSININEIKYDIRFLGGNINNLYKLLKDTLSNTIDVKMLNSSQDTRIISLTGKKEGKNQKISFDGDLSTLIDIQLLTTGIETETILSWNTETNNVIITNNSIQINTNYLIEPNTILSFNTVLTDFIPNINNSKEEKIALSNLNTDELGSISYGGLILPGATPILEDVSISKEEIIETLPIKRLMLLFDDDSKKEFELKTEEAFLPLEQFEGKTIVQVIAEVDQAILEISDITLRSTPEGELRPYKTVSKAQDSLFLLDGIEIQRPSNIISDLISGVTFELMNKTDSTINVKITPDLALIKDTIIQWIVYYNTIMEEIYTFTTIPLEKIGTLKPLHERELDEEDLKEGTFFGNVNLVSFKDRLRRMIASPHGNDQNSLNLLDQMGIYVHRQRSFSNDPDALRKGTLTVDVNELETKLKNNFEEIHRFFVLDTNGDLTGDKGLTVAAIDVNKMMIGGQGYLTKLEQNSRQEMQEMNTEITDKEDEVETISRRERQSLLQMNQAISENKALSESLQQRFRY